MEINRVGQIIFHRLQLHRVRFSQFVDNVVIACHVCSSSIPLEGIVRSIRGGLFTTPYSNLLYDQESFEEIRAHGERLGFKIITLDGQEALLAHVDFKTPERVGKYGLDLSALETVGVEALREAVHARQLVVIDEIGPMELRSPIFRDVVNQALDSGAPILATISARSLPFTGAIKERPDVTVIEVRPGNREQLAYELSDQFKK
ncbi:MAG: AAA family ATPase [Verrucomicrobia bacterium]|nr:MAG: AAA family ATPase [Verrucomicrobiota bacterium]